MAPSDTAACYVRRKAFLLPPPLPPPPPPAQPPTSVLASVLAPVAVSMASGLLALAAVGSACLLALRCRPRDAEAAYEPHEHAARGGPGGGLKRTASWAAEAGTGLGQRAAALASRGAAVGAEWGQRAAAAASSHFGKRGVQLLGVDRDAPLSPAHPAADKEDLSTGPDFGEPRAPLGASGQGSAAFHTRQQAAARTERFSRAEAAKPAAADVIGEILARSRASGRHAAPSAGEAAADDDDRRCRSPPLGGVEWV